MLAPWSYDDTRQLRAFFQKCNAEIPGLMQQHMTGKRARAFVAALVKISEDAERKQQEERDRG